MHKISCFGICSSPRPQVPACWILYIQFPGCSPLLQTQCVRLCCSPILPRNCYKSSKSQLKQQLFVNSPPTPPCRVGDFLLSVFLVYNQEVACLPLLIDYGFLKHRGFVLLHLCMFEVQHGNTKGLIAWMN